MFLKNYLSTHIQIGKVLLMAEIRLTSWLEVGSLSPLFIGFHTSKKVVVCDFSHQQLSDVCGKNIYVAGFV